MPKRQPFIVTVAQNPRPQYTSLAEALEENAHLIAAWFWADWDAKQRQRHDTSQPVPSEAPHG